MNHPLNTRGHQRLVADATSAPSALETYFTVRDVAALWKLSEDTVRRLFQGEPGVLIVSPRQRRGKRSYTTIRIPKSVLERVHKRCSLVR